MHDICFMLVLFTHSPGKRVLTLTAFNASYPDCDSRAMSDRRRMNETVMLCLDLMYLVALVEVVAELQ